jgi:hypothetical protein
VEDGDISIMDGGGITELDPAGDRLLVDISGFADEWLLRSSLVRRSKHERARAKVINLMLHKTVDAERGGGERRKTERHAAAGRRTVKKAGGSSRQQKVG